MNLSDEQVNSIALKVAHKLMSTRHNRVISNDEHNEHHLFIKQLKEEVMLDREAKRKIVQSGKIWRSVRF